MKVLKIAFSTNMSAVSRLNGVFAKLRIWGVAGIKDYITKKVSWWRMVNRLRSIAKRCSFPVDYKLVPVLPDGYFPSMKEWAEADVDNAAKWLRLCYDDPALRKEVGLKGKAFVEEHFSIENFKKSVEAFSERSKV
jgi:hypothetical protein